MSAADHGETQANRKVNKNSKRLPQRRNPFRGYQTFIPNLFKIPREMYPPFDKNDPFIRPEVLKNYLSLAATNSEGVPEYTANNPIVDDIINFSEDDWHDMDEAQNKWDAMEKERQEQERIARELEEQERKKKEAADSHIKQTLDHKVDQIFCRHYHFIKKTCPVMIPYKSSLNHEEHKAYLRAFYKFQIRKPLTAAESAEYENYLRLQNRVYEEQQHFMRFAYDVSKLQLKAYNDVPDVMSNYISDYVQTRCKRILDYPKNYVQEQSIPICPQDPTNRFSDLYFKHVGHLLSIGHIPWIKLPNPHTLCQVPLDDTAKKKEIILEPKEAEKFLYKTPVSEDPNAVYLAKKHQVNIVISTSAMKVIIDNYGPDFEKKWDIPIVIRNYTYTDDEGKEKQQRIVFVDKPFPKMIWTPSEKKQLFYKKSAVASMTELKRVGFFRMRCPLQFKVEKVDPGVIDMDSTKDDKNAAEYDEDFLDFYSATQCDVFGIGPSSPTRSDNVKNVKRKGKMEDFKTPERKKARLTESKTDTSTDKAETGTANENMSSSVTKNEEIENTKGDSLNITPKTSNAGGDSLNVTPKTSDTRGNSLNVTPKTSSTGRDSLNVTPKASNTGGDSINVSPKTSNTGGDSLNIKTPATGGESSVLDDLLNIQDSMLKAPPSSGSPVKQAQEEKSTRMRKLWPWSDTLPTKWEDHVEAKNFKGWCGMNAHYQLFEMGFNNSQPFNASQPLRVLVRHGLHGLSWYKSKRGQSKAYVLSTKPEYQVYFGCEVNTLSEITRQWLDLLVRPNAALLEVRVCQTSGDVMLTEEKTFASVLKEGKQQHISFTPQQPLATLHAVFNTLSALPTGKYVLHHDDKTKAFMSLMKATNNAKDLSCQTFDLHSGYLPVSVYTRTHGKPPWINIDTHKLTAFHVKHYKIPGTFPMDNPTKKLSKREKKKIKEKAMKKKRLDDLDKPDAE